MPLKIFDFHDISLKIIFTLVSLLSTYIRHFYLSLPCLKMRSIRVRKTNVRTKHVNQLTTLVILVARERAHPGKISLLMVHGKGPIPAGRDQSILETRSSPYMSQDCPLVANNVYLKPLSRFINVQPSKVWISVWRDEETSKILHFFFYVKGRLTKI